MQLLLGNTRFYTSNWSSTKQIVWARQCQTLWDGNRRENQDEMTNKNIFAWMGSERLSLYFGGFGVETRSLEVRSQPSATVRKRSKPFATVRNEDAMAVPIAIVATVVTVEGLKRCVTSFRVTGVALCDDKASKVVFDRRNTFARFSKGNFHFSWQAQHFGHVCVHFAWQAQHFRL